MNLVGDIGGTNARFARVRAGSLQLEDILTFSIADFCDVEDVLSAYLKEVGDRPAHTMLAIAGPVSKNTVKLTNVDWYISHERIERQLGLKHVWLLNDFVAIARALPHLQPKDLYPIGHARMTPTAWPKVAVGPGTGLGAAACLQIEDDDYTIIQTEAGHITASAANADEFDLIQWLSQKHSHVSVERIISGPGLREIYRYFAHRENRSVQYKTAEQITSAAVSATDPSAIRSLNLFCRMLGAFAGDMALTFGAKGGVYLAGGILSRFPEYLASSNFRSRFVSKGRMTRLVKSVPTVIIMYEHVGLLGTAASLNDRLTKSN